MEYDVFISHASEDKVFVRPLADAIQALGRRTWLDELQIGWGGSLSQSIDKGLSMSRYGIVVLSPDFFRKEWPQRELSGLVQRQIAERRVVILPIYHGVTNDDVRAHSPTLADALAIQSDDGPEAIARRLDSMLGTEASPSFVAPAPTKPADPFEEAKRLLRARDDIGLEDLLQGEADAAFAAMLSPEFDPDFRTNGNEEFFAEFKRRVARYEEVLNGLLGVQMAISCYGGEPHRLMLLRSLERLAEHPYGAEGAKMGGNSILLDLQRYPAHLSWHSITSAAVAGEKWGLLKTVFFDTRVSQGPRNPATEPLIIQMRPYLPFESSGVEQWLVKDSYSSNSRRYTPIEDHLGKQVVVALGRVRLFGEAAERTFDSAFFLTQLAYTELAANTFFGGGTLSGGRSWRIVSAYRGWENTPQAELVEKVKREGAASPVLATGLAKGDPVAFEAAFEELKKEVAKWTKW